MHEETLCFGDDIGFTISQNISIKLFEFENPV